MRRITKKDLEGISFDALLTKEYGKKGTKRRKLAEKKIKDIAKDLVKKNLAKEKCEYCGRNPVGPY